MRVLVAPDKFKGTLTAAEVAEAIARGLADEGIESRVLPLADGGDGSVAAALSAGFTAHRVEVQDAEGHTHEATFASNADTAVVEVANTCGLATLTGGLAPMTSSTYGFGQAILAARDAGCTRLVLALGGSASTDGGAGMLAALGVRFHDEHGRLVAPSAATLNQVTRTDSTALADLSGIELVIAGDVTNPLLGPEGAAAVFGPQKGLAPDQVAVLDHDLATFIRLLPELHGHSPHSLSIEPGAGAAGGLGFACRWLGGTRVPGADFFLDLLRFDDVLATCNVVITGEGSIDPQTLNGKLPAVVTHRSSPRPVHAVVGISFLGPADQTDLGLSSVHSLAEMTDLDTRSDPALSLTLAALAGQRIGRQLHTSTAPTSR